MSNFIITAKNMSGVDTSEVVEASNVESAIAQIQARDLFVISVKEVKDASVPAPVAADASSKIEFSAPKELARKFTHNKCSLGDIVSFSRQLATMIDSGVPLLRSLMVIAGQVESKQLGTVLDAVIRDVEGGQPFSRALYKYPKVFSPFWVSLVEVGEASGTMPKVLEKLTTYMEETAEFRSAVSGALVYPAVLITICMAAVTVFALFIGPIFEKIFIEMKLELPMLTSVVFSGFKFIKSNILLIILGGIGGGFLFMKYIKTEAGRRVFEHFLFRLPVFGKIFKLIVVEKFTSQMAILTDSGVPILYALEISERLVENAVCADVIKSVRDAVREGKLLAEPMEASAFFPPMAVQMIRVGEETGELGKMMNHVAVFYKKNVQDFLKAFSSLIEPFMLVFMGVVIGLIVVAMFLPIIKLSTGG